MRLSHLLLSALLVVAILGGCTRQKEPSPGKPVRVSATESFERYFGPAPTTDKGSCFAFVIYFPSAKEPGKVVPFPFFTFDEATLKNVAAQRLLTGMADVKAYRGEIVQPFPQGTRLLGVSEKDGVVTVDFSGELDKVKPDETAGRALATAVALTMKQFHGVKDVRVDVAGKDSRFSDVARAADERAVVQLPPPRLLNVTAVKEKGAKDVEAVHAYFDRPVEIKSLQIAGADGKPFRGDVFQSIFDMAGVLKPAEPEALKAGMTIRIRWSVTDKMGRSAAGDGELPLQIQEH